MRWKHLQEYVAPLVTTIGEITYMQNIPWRIDTARRGARISVFRPWFYVQDLAERGEGGTAIGGTLNIKLEFGRGWSEMNKLTTVWGRYAPLTTKANDKHQLSSLLNLSIYPSTWERSPQGQNLRFSTAVFASEVSRGSIYMNSDIGKPVDRVGMPGRDMTSTR